MPMPSSRWWWDLSTREFAALDMERIVAVLPVGAVEQHGPHLPVRVDAAISAGIVARAVAMMPDDLPALILPALPIGKSDEHLAYPGTLTIPHPLLGQLWFEVAKSAWRAGVRRIVVWNSHGGQVALVDILCRDLRVELEMLAVGASWFRSIDVSDLYNEDERRFGIHGGESETGIMLHLHPELVQMSLAEDFRPVIADMARDGGRLMPEGRIGFGWQAQDLHPAGVAGNAAEADARRGAIEVERAAAALVRLVGQVSATPLSLLSRTTRFEQR